MSTIRNVFAVLVHENQDCVIDLVRNLHALDPASLILLYNGGHDARLLADKFPFEQFGAVVHPAPRPAQWGRLHQFALDCMSWACDNQSFDTLTIVNSDHWQRDLTTRTIWPTGWPRGRVPAFLATHPS